MRRIFVNEVGRIQQIKRTDLIEKDLILHKMLLDLSKNEFFSGNFIFKGYMPDKMLSRILQVLRGHRLHLEGSERLCRQVSERDPKIPIKNHR